MNGRTGQAHRQGGHRLSHRDGRMLHEVAEEIATPYDCETRRLVQARPSRLLLVETSIRATDLPSTA